MKPNFKYKKAAHIICYVELCRALKLFFDCSLAMTFFIREKLGAKLQMPCQIVMALNKIESITNSVEHKVP
jgi:hypothetical protein